MRSSAKNTSFALLLATIGGGWAGAQEPPFRSRVVVQTVDVIALDASGKPALDLKPADLSIRVRDDMAAGQTLAESIAGATGGEFHNVVGTPDRILDDIGKEMTAGYRLGALESGPYFLRVVVEDEQSVRRAMWMRHVQLVRSSSARAAPVAGAAGVPSPSPAAVVATVQLLSLMRSRCRCGSPWSGRFEPTLSNDS